MSGWFQLGGFTDADEYYVVRGNVSHTTLNVLGKKVHLILCDGATLTLSGGILMYGDHRLYIHSQSYGGSMGKLVVQSGYNSDAAGIGSDYDGNSTSYKRTPADLEIHGGDIYAKGGDDAAGIGGGYHQHGGLVTIYGGKIGAHGSDGSGLAGNGGAGIGGGNKGNGGKVVIYDGQVYAYGGDDGAGIGSGNGDDIYDIHSGTVDIYGGYVEARGGYYGNGYAAGIGGGDDSGGAIVTIYNGTVKAWGGDDAAGIGSGEFSDAEYYFVNQLGIFEDNCHGGKLTVYDGNVEAHGGDYGAGIGGGQGSNGAKVVINGGIVKAYGGVDGAGIGSGETVNPDVNGGILTVNGGEVYAYGYDYGAGIGGGEDAAGANVTINGGLVEAKAGRNGIGMRAIGPGDGSDNYGTLTIGDKMMVISERVFTAGERVNACWYRTSARIEPCTHEDATYTVNGTGTNGTHTKHCQYCLTSFEPETHAFDTHGQCVVCGAKSTAGDVNGDGIVDIADVTALIRFVLSGDASSIVIENADVNGDGEFTISDVTILIGFVLKDDCTIHVINVEVTGADGLTFDGIGNGPAR